MVPNDQRLRLGMSQTFLYNKPISGYGLLMDEHLNNLIKGLVETLAKPKVLKILVAFLKSEIDDHGHISIECWGAIENIISISEISVGDLAKALEDDGISHHHGFFPELKEDFDNEDHQKGVAEIVAKYPWLKKPKMPTVNLGGVSAEYNKAHPVATQPIPTLGETSDWPFNDVNSHEVGANGWVALDGDDIIQPGDASWEITNISNGHWSPIPDVWYGKLVSDINPYQDIIDGQIVIRKK